MDITPTPNAAATTPSFSDDGSDAAPQAMLQDVDRILARLETGIAAEQIRMDALLTRLAVEHR
jgi:hypothetical protein